MKHFVKGDEPVALTEWKALANEHWQPTYGDLSGAVKEAVKESLLAEQGRICCYCERRLNEGDLHIEHLAPQSSPAVDPLDYSNMICSCQNQLKKGDPRHCGNLKENNTLSLTPLDADCEEHFTYTHNGTIQPKPQTNIQAKETIKTLGLDIPKLNNMRNKAIEPFLAADLEESELIAFVTGYLAKNGDGSFEPFWTTIKHLFGDSISA